MVSRAQIIDPPRFRATGSVFGATVTVLDENDKPVRYQIVGQTEATPTRAASPIPRRWPRADRQAGG
jgi:transcription elongation GreA/GreB family factor